MKKYNFLLIGLLIFAAVLGLSFLRWSYTNDHITAYADSAGHLNISRRLFDNLTPGIAQLGGAWLPIQHIMILPLVLNNFLYRTGLAGSLISFFCYIVSTLFIYKSIIKISKNQWVSLVSTLIFVLNPNILYLQTTPMTELPTIMFISMTIYFFITWIKDRKIYDLIFLGFILFLGSLTRYEFWAIDMFALIALSFILLQEKTNNKKWEKLIGILLVVAYISFFSIFLWLLWNTLIFNDPLYFLHSIFSAEGYQRELVAKNLNLPYHNILQAVLFFTHATADNSSWIIFYLALIGLILYLVKKFTFSRTGFALFTLSIFIFETFSIFRGNTTIYVKELFPFDYYNIRYGIYTLPFLIFYVGYLIKSQRKVFQYILGSGILLWIVIFLFQFQSVSFFEPLNNGPIVSERGARINRKNIADFVKRHYENGYVLISAGLSDEIILHSHIPMKYFITEGNQHYWSDSLKNPAKYASWVIVQSKKENIRNELGRKLYNNKNLFNNFDLVHINGDIEVYKKKSILSKLQNVPLQQSKLISNQTKPQQGKNTKYIVQEGDFLWQIAEQKYGDPFKWVEIAQKNNIVNPDFIYPGQELSL